MGCKGVVYCPRRVDTLATCAGTNPACTSGCAVFARLGWWPWSLLVRPGLRDARPTNQPMKENEHLSVSGRVGGLPFKLLGGTERSGVELTI